LLSMQLQVNPCLQMPRRIGHTQRTDMLEEVREIRTVIASSSGICSASLQIVFCFLMVLSGPCGCANAPHAAVRARFQGEFLDSSVDLGVDRLALLHSWVPGLIDINEVTSQTRVLRCHARGSCASVVPQSCLSQHGPSRECGSARAASLHLVWISGDLGLI
jgi:hypothetical protein